MMVCVKNYVLAVKVNGKILRENQGNVALPFGSEYALVLKNLNSRRAMVKVSVDGTDATEGTRLVLQPNASLTLERFIKNGNLGPGNRFKFIERTAGIESHRGIKEDDALVRCEFWSEKEVVDQPIVRHHYYDEWHPVPRPYYYPYPKPWYPWCESQITWGATSGNLSGGQSQVNVSCSLGDTDQATMDSFSENLEKCAGGQAQNASFIGAMNMAMNDAGITVPGSESNQQFHRSSGFQLETSSTVIVLQLRGEVRGVAVAEPVTVDRKPECVTCGKTNKATNKYCSECGTALQLI